MTQEDFGVAAVFATILSLLEMVSNVSAATLMVQASDGDEPSLQNTAQLTLAGRGVWNATLFVVLAGPFSRLFGIPDAQGAFRCLALIPLARGFTHLDPSRFQRNLRFVPGVLVEAVPNLVVMLLAFPLAIWFRNYWAMLWILVLQSTGTALGSHIVAQRRYRWDWKKDYARRLFTFGWPLLVNGILMYGIMEGDRVIIGSARKLFSHSTYTLADLGVYSVAFALMMAPTNFMATGAGSLFLPVLAKVKDLPNEFGRHYLNCLYAVFLAGAAISVPLVFAGGKLVTFIYGQKYAAAAGFAGWLAAMWGVRIIRVAPTVGAMARGDTRSAMFSNLGRSLALIGMVLAAATGSDLRWISISGFGGECLALAILTWRLNRVHGISFRVHVKPFALLGIGMLIAAAGEGVAGSLGLPATLVFCVVLVSLEFAMTMLVIPGLYLDILARLLPSRDLRHKETESVCGPS
jgi:O-antigen/teichoic acid export membrane protein